MFDRLGRAVLRLRWAFIVFWIAAAALFALFAPSLSKVGSADETSFLPADAESLAARQVIQKDFASDSAPSQALIVFSRTSGLTDADRAAIEGLRPWFAGPGHPDNLLRYVTAEGSPQLASMFRSPDGQLELARVDLSTPSFVPATNSTIDALRARLAVPGALPAGLTAQITGQAGIGRDYLQAIQDGTDRTTIVTIVLVVVVLLLIYRAPLAALVPLVTIGVAFLVSRGILGFLAQSGWRLSSVLDSFIVVLAFGVGTDYTIFLISRFREELGRNSRDDAVRATVARIGAVIAASAATVVVGLTSMVVARFGMIQTTGPALAIVIITALLAGLTLSPSLLAVFGRQLFWPRHESTRSVTDEDRGFWAALARRITTRPGVVAGVILVLLAAPLLALPQLQQNFDVLKELPSGAESRLGFVTLSRHVGQGQLMPLTVLVQAGNLDSEAALRKVAVLDAQIAALPDIQTVRSVVDPAGEGKISDLLRPKVQLAAMAEGFRKPSSHDINAELGPAALANLQSVSGYLEGLPAVFPQLAGATHLANAEGALSILQQGMLSMRKAANVANQLTTIADQIQAAGTSGTSDQASQLAALESYYAQLGTAYPPVRDQASYKQAVAALAALRAGGSQTTSGLALLSATRQLAAWFGSLPAPFYFVPSGMPLSGDALQVSQQMAISQGVLPGELDALAATFGPDDLYAAPSLAAAYESADRSVARIYVTTTTDPYDTRSFDAVARLRAALPGEVAVFGSPAGGAVAASALVGGASAEFADVQATITGDFQRVAFITIVGILLVLIVLLRALVAPVYLVLTVLLSYACSLSLSTLILREFFGQAGINYFIPLMVFVLLVALGSDYNIFLMSRVREESSTRPLRQGIRVASARTGTVITSAGLILAGTFGALVSSPLQLLFQVGFVVALGVLIDTFVVRSLLVPAITAFIGERAWWPFHRRGSSQES